MRQLGRLVVVAVVVGTVLMSAGTAFARVESQAALPAAPDLVASNISASTTLVGTNHSLSVTFTVTNSGDANAAQAWTDSAYLSLDTTIDSTDVHLGDLLHESDAVPAGSYTATITGTVPADTAAGVYYVLVQTDSAGNVAESSETNNVAPGAAQVEVDRPDLTATVTSPVIDGTTFAAGASVGSGKKVTVDYTVANLGLGDAIEPWTNTVYLSRDTTLDSGDIVLASDQEQANLPGTNGGSVQTFGFIDQNVTIPVKTGGGTWHLILKVDSSNAVDETPVVPAANNGESNNVIVGQTLTVNRPDLTATVTSPMIDGTTFAAGASVGSGKKVTIDYTLANIGGGDALTPWTNQVYLSRDQTLDGGDILLTTDTAQVSLPGEDNFPNGIAEQTSFLDPNITIPATTGGGTWYLLLKIDSSNQIDETPVIQDAFNGEINNVVVGQRIGINRPDLTATVTSPMIDGTTFAAGASVGSGRKVTIDYTLGNVGGGDAMTPWTNQVYLSRDQTLDANDVLLTTDTEQLSLPGEDNFPNGTAEQTSFLDPNITIPADTAAGTWYLILKVDSSNQIDETPQVQTAFNGEANNVVVGQTLTVNRPDLTATVTSPMIDGTTFAAGATVGSGRQVTIDYTIGNVGGGDAVEPWSNQVYLSRDTTLDGGDILLRTDTETSNLPAEDNWPNGTALTSSFLDANVTIPADTGAGTWHLILKIDSTNAVDETPIIPSAFNGEANNVVVGQTLTVNRPDLTATVTSPMIDGTNFAAGAFVGSGIPVTIDYTIGNVGAGNAVEPWSNQVYLSRDTTLDGGDILLRTDTETSDLPAEDNWPNGTAPTFSFADQGVVIPQGIAPGTWYLILKIDSTNAVDETPIIPSAFNGEANNVVVGQTLTVGAPDLQVAAPTITIPGGASGATPGGSVATTFTVTNGGAGNAAGSWNDKVYLSADGTLDAGDPLVDTVVHTGGLAAGGTYTVSNEAVTIPASTTPGTYRLFVRTDADNAVVEQDETNNVASSTTFSIAQITIAPATLPHATQGQSYTQVLTAGGGTGPYTFAVTNGSTPSSINLAANGTLSGMTTAHGPFTFTVTATDGIGMTGSRQYTLTVDYPQLTVSPATLPDGTYNRAYAQQLSVTGGAGPYTFALNTGSLPGGVHLSSAGLISGTPTAAGSFPFTVSVQDANGAPGSASYALTIAPDSVPPVTTAAATPAPNGAGWNTGDVTVTFTATDDNSGVQSIVYDTGGTPTTVAGSSTSFVIHDEGVTTVHYHAVDNFGNSETPKSLTVKIDHTAPTTSCGTADGAWHGSNVSIACTASDGNSGLANAADASFSLTTSVAAGTTDANASTNSRSVCDAAGNCATAGPVAGNKIDRQAPSITITKPAAGDVYAVNQVVTPVFSCSDAGAGGGTCTGPAVDTSTPGPHTYTVTATDSVGNTTTKSVSYSVGYSFSGFFGISNTALNSAKSGDTVPMQFSLNGNFGLSVLAAGQPVAVQINCTTRATIGSSSPTLGFLAFTPSTTLYTYSWNTQTAWKKLCIRFSMTLKDGTTHSADFQFR